MIVLASVALLLQAAPPPRAADQYARRYRLWDSSGSAIAVVPYRFVLQSPDGQQVTAVTVQLRQWNADQSDQRDSSWVDAGRHSSGSTAAEFAGYIVTPRTEALAFWSLLATGDGGQSKVRVDDHQIPRDDGGLALSDLVLGSAANSIEWRHGELRTLLSLSDIFDRHATIHVYYQVRSASARGGAATTLTFTDVTDPHRGKFVLRFSSTARLVAGLNDRTEVVDPSRLGKGKYRLELQVGDPAVGGASVRAAEFELR